MKEDSGETLQCMLCMPIPPALAIAKAAKHFNALPSLRHACPAYNTLSSHGTQTTSASSPPLFTTSYLSFELPGFTSHLPVKDRINPAIAAADKGRRSAAGASLQFQSAACFVATTFTVRHAPEF